MVQLKEPLDSLDLLRVATKLRRYLFGDPTASEDPSYYPTNEELLSRVGKEIFDDYQSILLIERDLCHITINQVYRGLHPKKKFYLDIIEIVEKYPDCPINPSDIVYPLHYDDPQQ